MKDSNEQERERPRGRKSYSAPVLTEYGSVSKLTMAKGGSFVESPTLKKSNSCL